MTKGKTKSGFEYEANEKIRKDWRFVKALADADSGDASRQLRGMTSVVALLLTEECEDRLMAHVATEDGTVPTEKVMGEVKEIMNHMGEQLKN